MNSLFNSALKQSSALRRDLDAFADAPGTSSPALQGQISASLTSLSRTLDEYAEMAKKELVPDKQEKAHDRLKNFRVELADYRQSFDLMKKNREDSQTAQNRTELLGRRPHHTATPENPYSQSNLAQNSAFAPSKPQSLSFGAAPQDYTRETHALREQNFMSSTNAALDEYLERGRAVLGDLGDQREMLKGTQKKLYSVANTLGQTLLDPSFEQQQQQPQVQQQQPECRTHKLHRKDPNSHLKNSAPAPPSINSSSSSFTDVDSQHIKSEASETAEQAKEKTSEAADKTKQKSSEAAETSKEKSSDYAQTAKEKAREAADYTKEKSSEFADSASKNYDSAKKSAEKNAREAKKEIKSAGQDLNENRDNPVVIANGVLIVAGSAALGYGAYTKHVKGELDWQLAAITAGVVGVLAVGDYYLSQYLFKNKYPKK